MTDTTKRAQVSTSEMSDTERRRRLAAIYRLLIHLSKQNNVPAADYAVQSGGSDSQTEATHDSLSAQEAVQA